MKFFESTPAGFDGKSWTFTVSSHDLARAENDWALYRDLIASPDISDILHGLHLLAESVEALDGQTE